MELDLQWRDSGRTRHARAEVHVRLRRVLGTGWPGWPAYLVGIKLLRALG